MIRIARRMTTTIMGLGIGLALLAGAAAAELKVGDKAPDFTIQGSDGKTYTLDQFKGKSAVVIAWFPKAFTGGCTKECKSLRANSKALKELNVAYFTASVDTPEDNKKFAESLDLDYPILSDPDKTVAQAYGVMMPTRRPHQSLDLLHRQGRDHQGDRQEGATPTRPARTSPPRSRSWASTASESGRAGDTKRNHGKTRNHTEKQPDGPARSTAVGTEFIRVISCYPWFLSSSAPHPGRACCSARCRAWSSAHRYFSSPRIRQKSWLCIRPGTRRQTFESNVCGSVYSR